MAPTVKSRERPLEGAVSRIVTLAGRSPTPGRMAREIEIIVGEWEAELGGEIDPVRERVQELLEMLEGGVTDAEEQVSDVDRSDEPAARQAQVTLVALTACRDKTAAWLDRYGR